ncbi:hypothetical protein DL769_004772 [Monosporascus sp. CRB-8-3]|nr:hypothetical protein DL769_004772 [Monosporascus sp. CRB-8-3]
MLGIRTGLTSDYYSVPVRIIPQELGSGVAIVESLIRSHMGSPVSGCLHYAASEFAQEMPRNFLHARGAMENSTSRQGTPHLYGGGSSGDSPMHTPSSKAKLVLRSYETCKMNKPLGDDLGDPGTEMRTTE